MIVQIMLIAYHHCNHEDPCGGEGREEAVEKTRLAGLGGGKGSLPHHLATLFMQNDGIHASPCDPAGMDLRRDKTDEKFTYLIYKFMFLRM